VVNSENGLPPADAGIRLHSIDPGKILAVGSFGTNYRAWCATVDISKGKPIVNVFFEGIKLRVDTKEDPDIAFKPRWIQEVKKKENNQKIVLVGRDSDFQWPLGALEINLSDLSVKVSLDKFLHSSVNQGVEYEGGIYTFTRSRAWRSRDPKNPEAELLVTPKFPRPYSDINYLWVSAHYGFVGWATPKGDIYQIKVSDSEQVYAKFHKITFENENGPVTDKKELAGIRIYYNCEKDSVLYYTYSEFESGLFLRPGTYCAYSGSMKSESLQVTEQSPENLIFKTNSTKVKYYGRVVDAVTGKPIEGAFVMVNGIDDDLSEISPEQWKLMRKLPQKPFLPDKALLLLKDVMNGQDPEETVRTDAEGYFEMSLTKRRKPSVLGVFGENYLNSLEGNFGAIIDGSVNLGTFHLYPAAKVKIYPCAEELNSGRPCRETQYMHLNLEIVPDGHSYSANAKIYFEKPGFPLQIPELKVNEYRTYYVPAGFSYKLKLKYLYNDHDDRWIIPEIPQIINVKQGETIDLGRVVFKPKIVNR